jgi:hypothetical protein
MAKLTTNTIQGSYASTAELNANFELIEDAMEKALFLDGTTPNTMSADIDMDGNDILNVGTLNYTGVTVSASDVDIDDAGAIYTATEVESALAEVKAIADTAKTTNDTQDTAIALNTAKVTDSFVSRLAGYDTDTFHVAYASDLDTILANSKYSFTTTGVTNEPSGLTVGLATVDTIIDSGGTAEGYQVVISLVTAGQSFHRIRTGGAWGSWSGFSGGGDTVSATAPSNPEDGDGWWDTTKGKSYIYFEDGDSNQWVERQAGPMGQNVVVQMVNTQDGALATGTTLMVKDDSIPQNTEGDEYMTLAITPTSAANTLKIEVDISLANSVGNWLMAALFQDSTADAINGTAMYEANNNTMHKLTMVHWMTAGTTAATTFKVRAGGHGAGTMTFGGDSATRVFGGVLYSSITITEISA